MPVEFCISSCSKPECRGPTSHHSASLRVRLEGASSLSEAVTTLKEVLTSWHDREEFDPELCLPESSPSRIATNGHTPSPGSGSLWAAEPNGTC